MDAWLERYLDLAALDVVGAALVDPRSAFVASDDGATIAWANAAGLRQLRARSMRELSGRAVAETSRLREQLARLSRTLPADRSRLEALAFPLTPWPAACRRLNLADGTRAVLAVGRDPAPSATLRARAEQLMASFAGAADMAAVVDAGGRILAASDALDAAAVAQITDDASRGRRSQHRIVVGDREVAAHVVGFEAEGMALRLVVVDRELAWQPPTSRDRVKAAARAAPQPEPPRAAPAPQPEPMVEAAPSGATVEAAAAIQSPPPPEPIVAAPPAPPPAIAAPTAAATAAADVAELSGSEADAFQRIREALGRNGARLSQAPPPPVEPPAVRITDAREVADEPPAAAPAPPFDATLLDRLAVGVVIFRERRVLLANRTVLDLLGFDSADAFEAAGGAEAMFADGNGAWAGGDFDDRDGRLAVQARDGRLIPVEARLNTVSFAGATALMVSVIPRAAAVEEAEATSDPTAAERRIHDLETILNTATDGVLTLDRHGTIMSMNRAAEALFAVDVGDFKGRSFTELLAEESRRTALDYIDGLASNGVASVLNDGREVIGRVPHGGLIPLYMTMGRLGDSGRFSAVLRDITHWKTIEEELTAARREAEAANAQKSEFLAKISHEIRTPLNAIIGFSEIMMEQRFGPIGNDRYRAYLNDIHVSGAHLMSLINDLLDLSKIEAGKVELTFEAVAVNAVIQECVALMQPLANRERIIIRTSLSTDLPAVVADQRSFRQILLNLLSNAIKFTRAGGQVIVSTLLEDSGEVVVRIRDTGIGMSAREIETAMKPFEQVAIAQGDREKGTGLGLPLTKAMVEANRATFAIESAPNQGTLVRITFPTTRVLAS